jgi:hypothetical protein
MLELLALSNDQMLMLLTKKLNLKATLLQHKTYYYSLFVREQQQKGIFFPS